MLIETIILGFIQGITEWMPVSSTGHLRIAENFLGLELPLLFDLILHIGTLLITILFFRLEIKKMIYSLVKWEFKTSEGRFIPLIIIGMIPTIIIGFLFNSSIVYFFNDFAALSGAYILCGVLLYLSKIGKEKKDEISYFEAFQIGLIQGVAVIPGLSRSGLTLAVALLLGIKKEIAFKFSFLLSIPAIIGGLSLTFYEQWIIVGSVNLDLFVVIIGVFISSLIGYLSLKILQKIVIREKLYFFAFYCWILGILLILFVSLIG
jgi:undecaprenyl-diphosphatase